MDWLSFTVLPKDEVPAHGSHGEDEENTGGDAVDRLSIEHIAVTPSLHTTATPRLRDPQPSGVRPSNELLLDETVDPILLKISQLCLALRKVTLPQACREGRLITEGILENFTSRLLASKKIRIPRTNKRDVTRTNGAKFQ